MNREASKSLDACAEVCQGSREIGRSQHHHAHGNSILNNRKSVWDFAQPGRARKSARQAVAADTAILAGEWSGINTPSTVDELRAADELVLGVFDAAHQLDDGRTNTEVLRPLFSMHAGQPTDSIAAAAPLSTLPDEVTPPVDQPGDLLAPNIAPADEPAQAKRPRKTSTKKKGQPPPAERVDDGTVSCVPASPVGVREPRSRRLSASHDMEGGRRRNDGAHPGLATPEDEDGIGPAALAETRVNAQPPLRIVTATWPAAEGLRTASTSR